MKMSDSEKLIALMLCDIYEKLGVDGDIDAKFVSTSISNDMLWGLKWEYSFALNGPTSEPPEVKETVDILTMWRDLEYSYNELSPSDKADVDSKLGPHNKVEFPGFDGNHEPHHAITRYLVNDLERFTELEGRNINSHMTSVPMYKRMLEEYKNQTKKNPGVYSLDKDQIIEIMSAKAA